jgi:dipeptidyl aminopeptidase/acylaminoacyl peptidase
MRPADFAQLRVPSDPSLSPDGRLAVVAVAQADLDADAYRSALWLVATDGSAPPRRLTNGPRDTRPRWSPDGRWIAFLRAGAEHGAKPQLHVMAAAGGEPRRLAEHPLGAEAHTWDPGSRRLAYLARVPEPGRYGTDPDVPPEREPPRRIRAPRYRADGLGWSFDRRRHLFTVELPEGDEDPPEPVQLTEADADHADPAWSPDGRLLAVVSARHPGRDHDIATDVFTVPAKGGELTRLTRTDTAVARPAFAPDGDSVHYVAPGSLDLAGRTTGLWVVPADGSGAPRRLSDAERDDLDVLGATSELPLLADEGAVTTVTLRRGAVHLVAFPLAGGDPAPLLTGDVQVSAYDRKGGVTVAVISTATSAGELVRLTADPDRPEPLTSFAADLELASMAPLSGTAPDGVAANGWLVKPAGPGPHPVLLCIHGGPHAQYGYTLFDEAQVYAAAGYAVVLGNPRGSAGYGDAHGRAIVGALGGLDRDDLLALLDAALADPDLDAGRVGVMGGSYGGYMTTWLAANHGERFVAAISERAVNALDSMEGTSDIGWFFVSLYFGADPAARAAQDPLAVADRITIPMLLIHSEHDYRCPLEQAQRLFVRLQAGGVESELLVFPGEGHELSRSGLPSHRVARFEAVLAWWARHLPTAANGQEPG